MVPLWWVPVACSSQWMLQDGLLATMATHCQKPPMGVWLHRMANPSMWVRMGARWGRVGVLYRPLPLLSWALMGSSSQLAPMDVLLGLMVDLCRWVVTAVPLL
jgi:hypothetical protein